MLQQVKLQVQLLRLLKRLKFGPWDKWGKAERCQKVHILPSNSALCTTTSVGNMLDKSKANEFRYSRDTKGGPIDSG